MAKVSLCYYLGLQIPNTNAGYATASVEGRIAVEYFDSSPASQEKKYAFKCHRQTIKDVDHVWPVNCLAFHPTYNTFASAGSDGTVSIWDHKVKKRLKQYPKYPGPVASVAFNCDGTKLAVGISYTWDEGEQGMKTHNVTPWIGVKKVGDEIKVRFPTVFPFFIVFLIRHIDFHSQNRRHELRFDDVLVLLR
jgi:cell cycle arrest protein BUB3